jgi:hypothetical protein
MSAVSSEFFDTAPGHRIVAPRGLSLIATMFPDHIFIAETIGDEEWHSFRPVADGVFSIDMPYFGRRSAQAVSCI